MSNQGKQAQKVQKQTTQKPVTGISKDAICHLKIANLVVTQNLKSSGYSVRVHFVREKVNGDLILVATNSARDGKRYTVKQAPPRVSQSGGFTSVVLSKAGEKTIRTSSRCSKSDNFCRAIGTNIALERALSQAKVLTLNKNDVMWYSEMTPGDLAPPKKVKIERPEFAKFKKQSEKVTVNA